MAEERLETELEACRHAVEGEKNAELKAAALEWQMAEERKLQVLQRKAEDGRAAALAAALDAARVRINWPPSKRRKILHRRSPQPRSSQRPSKRSRARRLHLQLPGTISRWRWRRHSARQNGKQRSVLRALLRRNTRCRRACGFTCR